ncbi:hypothetical protein SARC_10110 [Sphaeroforma arctica JP610]|uniref:Uncharacterized protein n=1 Tax=Sphaeroforma arctica JP610 TaxID=667725 RepID=A0A0L0FLS2_9EUKA|nr:hypothetical protein SARC_10110 [Sphaeroforma arctica JP610]KNC77431.1 hypothetical protein SARC_10110 [Sphaeroforma arctica JP610]|eukprot:XP_014151333.1 hypothetical protein SARC_10110 [Sphaeroforma arctica JP610]
MMGSAMCMSFTSQNCRTLSQTLMMGFFFTIWIQQFSWIITNNSEKNFLPPQLSLGFSLLPDIVGVCLLWFAVLSSPASFLSIEGTTARLDKDTIKKVGYGLCCYSFIVWGHSMNMAPAGLVPAFVEEHWFDICTYGALTACLLCPNVAGVVNGLGIVCIIFFLQATMSSYFTSPTISLWQQQATGLLGCLLIAVGTKRTVPL